MKRLITLTGLVSVLCVSCFPTRIVTVSSTPVYEDPIYSTTITVPRRQVTTTTQVYATDPDISLQLDLQAVAAAFAQSSTIKEFETLLNDSSYMLSNLDLNRDGYVDYLRVMSAMQGYNHVFVIQAVIAPNVYQDVATIVAEVPSYTNYHVEIIGDPFIYGPDYIVSPIFIARPHIFGHICRHDYIPWHSPWYWGHFPSYYRHPAPVFVSHYHAYVHTFMSHHHYCHEVRYPSHCHYRDYRNICGPVSRNDYSRQHPDRSFSVRNANVPVSNSAVDRAENARRQANASDVRRAYESSRVTSSSASRGGSSASAGSSATRGGSSASAGSSATRGGSSTAAGSSATRSGSSASAGSSATRGGSSTAAGSSATRGGSSTAAGSSASRSSSSTSTRSSSSGSVSSSRGSTTTSSRVNPSGSSSTKTKTVSPSGSTSTVRRGSSSSSSTSKSGSSRASSSSSSSNRSSGTRASSSSSSSSNRSSGSRASSSSSSRSSSSSSSRSGSSSRR
ncbi:MAG: hypothetical protein PUB45_02075 [Bacteroidales bacterium]|nr:hypothetical protein [Bacteroidales bacterium]